MPLRLPICWIRVVVWTRSFDLPQRAIHLAISKFKPFSNATLTWCWWGQDAPSLRCRCLQVL